MLRCKSVVRDSPPRYKAPHARHGYTRAAQSQSLALAAPLKLSTALVVGLLAFLVSRFFPIPWRNLTGTRNMASTPANALPKTQAQWKAALDALPDNPARIPAFFFGHGSPMLAFSEEQLESRNDSIVKHFGPKGPLAIFLRDFGPALLAKYKPKAVVVFSAHWDTHGERQGE